MESLPKIFADFNKGRIRLTTVGSTESIEKLKLKLEPGLKVMIDDYEELSTIGCIEFSEEEKIWVARIDWAAINYLKEQPQQYTCLFLLPSIQEFYFFVIFICTNRYFVNAIVLKLFYQNEMVSYSDFDKLASVLRAVSEIYAPTN